ncbi:MAG: hypothetical protein LBR21_02280 [Propionibacteriaceae bacterium]|jgi:hypothetical protein|nr:hypothetical protein [Propionibacteriaceae bacterium]
MTFATIMDGEYANLVKDTGPGFYVEYRNARIAKDNPSNDNSWADTIKEDAADTDNTFTNEKGAPISLGGKMGVAPGIPGCRVFYFQNQDGSDKTVSAALNIYTDTRAIDPNGEDLQKIMKLDVYKDVLPDANASPAPAPSFTAPSVCETDLDGDGKTGSSPGERGDGSGKALSTGQRPNAWKNVALGDVKPGETIRVSVVATMDQLSDADWIAKDGWKTHLMARVMTTVK